MENISENSSYNMEIEQYLTKEKEFYEHVIKFIESESDDEYYSITQSIENIKQNGSKDELLIFFHFISNISGHHHRGNNFKNKIEKILSDFSVQLKETMSNLEMFHLFKSNMQTILFLIKNNLIIVDKSIFQAISTNSRYRLFFYPEIKSFLQINEQKIIEKRLNPSILSNFEINRQEGQNDSYICSLIQNDSIEEFITYINQKNLSTTSRIKSSIFETNSFLIDKTPTLIEYATFYGSIQIFQYLVTNGVQLTESLWLYAIHSNNSEMIYYLEEKHIKPKDGTFKECLIESIKCHHNDFSNYILNNLITENNFNYYEYCFRYYNYPLFPEYSNECVLLCYSHIYGYSTLYNIVLQKMKREKLPENEKKISQFPENEKAISQSPENEKKISQSPENEKTKSQFEIFQKLANENDTDAIYHILSKHNQIKDSIFEYNQKIDKIVIPSSITSIGNKSFYKCSKLKLVIILSSLKTVGSDAFNECSSLINITLPSTVTSIGKGAFYRCGL